MVRPPAGSNERQNLAAATMPRTSLQPSSIIEMRASRKIFSIGQSREIPAPPNTCSASLATSNAACVEVTLEAMANSSSGVSRVRR